MRITYATVDTATLAVMAASDPSAHDAYTERCASIDAIVHLLHPNAWEEINPTTDAAYFDPENTGPIATAEIMALLGKAN